MDGSIGNSGAVQGEVVQAEPQAAGGGGRSGWQMLRTILFQMVVFYFISSFFRGRQQPATPVPDGAGRHPAAGGNLFPKDQNMVRVAPVRLRSIQYLYAQYAVAWEAFNMHKRIKIYITCMMKC